MKRDISIDLMKFLLVIGMILAHVIQFFSNDKYIGNIFSLYINMITFSGFLFCFGYVCNIAYFNKNKKDIKVKFVNNSIKMLIAFYISGFTFSIFVTQINFDIISALKIILLWNIPGYSEFLISFAVINILTYVFFEQIKFILKNKSILIIIIGISLISTFIPYNSVKINQIGILIGSNKFASFPILQYLPFYLIGMYFQKNNITFRWKYINISIISSSIIIIYTIIFNELPSRFPPSLVWILSPSIYIYLYYLACKQYSKKYEIPKCISLIGENTLYFLLSSNIIIFITKYIVGETKFSLSICIIFAIIITSLSYKILKLIRIRGNIRRIFMNSSQ